MANLNDATTHGPDIPRERARVMGYDGVYQAATIAAVV